MVSDEFYFIRFRFTGRNGQFFSKRLIQFHIEQNSKLYILQVFLIRSCTPAKFHIKLILNAKLFVKGKMPYFAANNKYTSCQSKLLSKTKYR